MDLSQGNPEVPAELPPYPVLADGWIEMSPTVFEALVEQIKVDVRAEITEEVEASYRHKWSFRLIGPSWEERKAIRQQCTDQALADWEERRRKILEHSA